MNDIKQKGGHARKPSDTWSIRGISPETRQAAKRAARKSGQTLGVWLDEQIRLAATQKLTEGDVVVSVGGDTMKEVLARLEALESDRKTNVPIPFWRRWFGG